MMQSTLLPSEKPCASCFSIFSLLVILCGIAALSVPTKAVAGQTWYVNTASSSASDDTSHGTSSKPWKTVKYAAAHIAGGDIVNIYPGTYPDVVSVENLIGSPSNYTTFQQAPGTTGRPYLSGTSGSNYRGTFQIYGCKYLLVYGLEVSDPYDLAAKTDQYGGGSGISTYNQSIDKKTNYSFSTYVTVENCKVHDCGSGGIGFSAGADFIKIDGNEVYGCAVDTPFSTSGISLLSRAGVSDGSSVNHVTITNNQVHNCVLSSRFPNGHYDGNGIILDTSQAYSNGGVNSLAPPCLVDHNNCYSNGGSGIRVTQDSNVTVTNNTLSYDLKDPAYANTGDAELQTLRANKCIFQNNRVTTYSYPSTGLPRIYSSYQSTNITVTNNGPGVTF